MDDIILNIEHVTKRFPGVIALDDVSFSIRTGEVHGIVGENGAGKSTLIKAIMGVHSIDEGRITVKHKGQYVQAKDALDAKRLGMYANYQHVSIADSLTVAENYFLGNQPMKAGRVDWKRMYAESKKVLEQFNMPDVDPRKKIEKLPIALKEMIVISKISMFPDINLVIFDEPTALLEENRVDELFRYIGELKKQGISIIYISHHLEEIVKICDRVTVLKDGCYVTTRDAHEVDRDKLIYLMVGRKIADIYDIKHAEPGDEVLRVEGLARDDMFQDISFNVRSGEILGFFGLVGAGRSEVMRAIYGADKRDAGTIHIDGKKMNIENPVNAMRAGIGLIPEDRAGEGVALDLTVNSNINLSSYDMISKAGVISLKKERERSQKYVDAMRIKTPSLRQKLKNLSGGNQQKTVISKLMCRDPKVYIFDEPTVGVDVGAKQEIYHLIEEIAGRGKAIILISSYLPEVLGLADRLIVLAEGKITGEMKRGEWTEEKVLKLASSES